MIGTGSPSWSCSYSYSYSAVGIRCRQRSSIPLKRADETDPRIAANRLHRCEKNLLRAAQDKADERGVHAPATAVPKGGHGVPAGRTA